MSDSSLISFIQPSHLEIVGPTKNVANTVEGLSHESCMLGASADFATPKRSITVHFSRPFLFKYIEMKPHKQFNCCQQQFNGIDIYYKSMETNEWIEIATVKDANSDDYLYRLDLGEFGLITQSFKLTRFPSENVSVGMMKCYGRDVLVNHQYQQQQQLPPPSIMSACSATTTTTTTTPSSNLFNHMPTSNIPIMNPMIMNTSHVTPQQYPPTISSSPYGHIHNPMVYNNHSSYGVVNHQPSLHQTQPQGFMQYGHRTTTSMGMMNNPYYPQQQPQYQPYPPYQ
ncbi:hypothetical protein C9374_007352 [Naegleria lovaniensis]|uniref:Uncharacterized protein n=1 Tax=Naegleria lovaniensis TaxID=51637 RepID=A0AA88KIT1_NAELO|nr:uncharacterized protein C9374_007352 [Naegleria lovaniensis]KAG2379213.1 hypothetical protein C9374_007352 [Naegleria lovaniensis]